jgi:hypothetical protein
MRGLARICIGLGLSATLLLYLLLETAPTCGSCITWPV